MADVRPAGVAPRRWRRRALVALTFVLGAWLLVAVVLAALGARAAAEGRAELRSVADRLDPVELFDSPELLAPAHEDFDTADRWLSHPLLRPFEVVPVAGRQLKTSARLAATAADLLAKGTSTLEAVTSSIDRGTGSGPARLRVLQTVDRELRSLDAAAASTDLGPAEALVGPVARARQEAESRLRDLRAGIADARTVVRAARDLLTGPSAYLVVAANNAEMRVGSGMFLSMGRVEFADGEITVDRFHPAVDLQLSEPVDLDPEIERLWGWARPGREWRNLGLTPRFPVNAELAEEMWRAGGHPPVDGVLLLDVLGLQHLLRAVGPVDVEGSQIAADGVVPLLMHQQYVGIEDGDDNAARREQLSAVAEAVVERVGAGAADVASLVSALRSAQRGRHLMLWSSAAPQQAAWKVAGLDGELDDRSVAVGVANIGGNKLDQFLDVDVDVSSEPAGADDVEITMVVNVENETPADEPPYVLGADPDGAYRGVVTAYVPRSATILGVEGGSVVASGPDGPSDAVGVAIEVPRLGEVDVEISFVVPTSESRQLHIVPSARIPPQRWRVEGQPAAEGGRLLPRRAG